MSPDKDISINLFKVMKKIRLFEEAVADMIERGEIRTPCHLYIGQEAVAAGACLQLTNEDTVYSNHRSHGHYIAKGGNLNQLMAEILCKETGCSRGRGGSMHLFSKEVGFPGSTAIVGGSIPLAVGAALFYKIMNKKNVAVTFFGDGAASEGIFYEALNFAALYKLPVIFICENNLYATHMPITRTLNNINISDLIKGFNILNYRIDGNDVLQIYDTVKKCYNNCIKGGGPAFIECLTYRWRGHVGPNYDVDKGLRTKEELDFWMESCPIKKLENNLLKNNTLTKEDLSNINNEILTGVNEAINFGKKSPYPEPNDYLKHVFR